MLMNAKPQKVASFKIKSTEGYKPHFDRFKAPIEEKPIQTSEQSVDKKQ